MNDERALRIYIDESGGLEVATDDDVLFILSLVAVEETPGLISSQADLNHLLSDVGYTDMIHTAPLVRWGDEYKPFTLGQRRKIFWAMQRFGRNISAKKVVLIIDRTTLTSTDEGKNLLANKIASILNDDSPLLAPYDLVSVCYDCGQQAITDVITRAIEYSEKSDFEPCFNKVTERPFQLADLATFTEKLAFKLKNGLKLTRSEEIFFLKHELELIQRQSSGELLN